MNTRFELDTIALNGQSAKFCINRTSPADTECLRKWLSKPEVIQEISNAELELIKAENNIAELKKALAGMP